MPLIRGKTFKYTGMLFEVGRKLKVFLAAKRMKFFRAFNFILAALMLPLLLWFYVTY